MEIVVINLMRLGDLIQSTPVFRRLRQQYPQARLTLVVQDLFRETAALVPGVDRLLLFPSIVLARHLDREGGWAEALKYLEAWLGDSFPRRPEVVINLTPNFLGGILAHLTQAPDCRGIIAGRRWTLSTRPAWASYALVVSLARQANPFNLVDLFLREGGLTPDGQGTEVAIPPAADQEAAGFFHPFLQEPAPSLIGLMPGASRPERCWPAEFFAQAARMLLGARSCHFFIFGSSKEAPLGETIARQLPEGTVTLLVGQTSPALLAASLKRLDVLITNDTGPMHLAAAVGTPTLALFLATARVQDTGPVGPGHVILEPRLECHPCLSPCPVWRCHQAITPESVACWAARVLDSNFSTPLDAADSSAEVRVSLSTTDPEGYHTYLPLVKRPLERRDFWLWLHRLTWGHVLDDRPSPPVELQSWLEEVLERHYLPPEEDLALTAGRRFLQELCQAARQGEKTAGRLFGLAEVARDFPGRLWQQVEALGVVDQDLRRLGAAFPELRAWVEFFFQEQRDNEGEEILALAGRLQQSYSRLRCLGEGALDALTWLAGALAVPVWEEDFGNMAQSLQRDKVDGQAMLPKREELSCR